MPSKRPKKKKEVAPTGIADIDVLAEIRPCTIEDYIRGVSGYVREQSRLDKGAKKASQIRLSNALARSLAHDIESRLPNLAGRLVTDEQKVAGGLRIANADVSESHPLDGLRLAVELKPINLAVGRAIWNRFGDIRTFAVNIHLKFPFAVVGGVLVIPTYEETGTRAAKEAEKEEENIAEGSQDNSNTEPDAELAAQHPEVTAPRRKPTVHLIERAIDRLVRAGSEKARLRPLTYSKRSRWWYMIRKWPKFARIFRKMDLDYVGRSSSKPLRLRIALASRIDSFNLLQPKETAGYRGSRILSAGSFQRRAAYAPVRDNRRAAADADPALPHAARAARMRAHERAPL